MLLVLLYCWRCCHRRSLPFGDGIGGFARMGVQKTDSVIGLMWEGLQSLHIREVPCRQERLVWDEIEYTDEDAVDGWAKFKHLL